MSINQIEQFRRSYGWTPPFGYTESQLKQYMDDNPNATPEELEAGAKQTTNGTAETEDFLSGDYFKENYSDAELKGFADKFGASKWYTSKSKDIDRFLELMNGKIEEARSQGISDSETLAFIIA